MSLTVEEQIATKLKQLRVKAGYSSAEAFAYEIGINRSQYQLYEKSGKLRLASLIVICKAHSLSLSQFFKGIEIPND